MKIGTVSLGEVGRTMWVPTDFLNHGFKGRVSYLRLGSIVVLCHPTATEEEIIKSLLACARKIKSKRGEFNG